MEKNQQNENKCIGRVISVSSLKIEVFLEDAGIGIRDLLCIHREEEPLYLEVAEINGSVAAAISCGPTNGLKRGMEVYRVERLHARSRGESAPCDGAPREGARGIWQGMGEHAVQLRR